MYTAIGITNLSIYLFEKKYQYLIIENGILTKNTLFSKKLIYQISLKLKNLPAI